MKSKEILSFLFITIFSFSLIVVLGNFAVRGVVPKFPNTSETSNFTQTTTGAKTLGTGIVPGPSIWPIATGLVIGLIVLVLIILGIFLFRLWQNRQKLN